MDRWSRRVLILFVLIVRVEHIASAQSVSATLSGTVSDEQGHVVPGASITARNVETGQVRKTASDDAGRYRLIGLPPGLHRLDVEFGGFEPQHVDVTLVLDGDATLDVTFRPAALRETVVVSSGPTLVETVRTILGRSILSAELDALPVPGRVVTSLATMTPGVLTNLAGNATASTSIVASGQTGRGNTFLLDGLSLDDTFQGIVRGGPPLDAVREYVVMTNGFTAEYGQASGAIVSVLTRSGSNRLAGRTSYYHRDDRWDARPATARLLPSSSNEARFEQKALSGSVGGPLVPDRTFFFGAVEATDMDTGYLITTPGLTVHRPGEPPSVPMSRRRWQVFGRADANRTNESVTLRYRLDDTWAPGTFVNVNSGKNTPEARYDSLLRNQDVGASHTRAWGRGMNELRFLAARHDFRFDPGTYCEGVCPDFVEDHPGITLGRNFLQSRGSRIQWQVSDAVTWVRTGPEGQHTLSAGGEARAVRSRFIGSANSRGTFIFRTDAPFDTRDARTYPVFYSQNVGDPDVRPSHTLGAIFLQDRWATTTRVTLNLGVRWDYDSLRAVSRDRNNVAPRLGVAISLDRARRITARASYGLYYDQVPLAVVQEFEQAQHVTQLLVSNPGFPDWRGPNPNRRDSVTLAPPSIRQLGDLQTPYATQVTAGLERSIAGFGLSIDGVWADGRNLLLTHDRNAPDAAGRRPDSRYQLVRMVESPGHSWYKGLNVGLLRRSVRGPTVSAVYTLSSATRDTEDFDFTPQDQDNFADERGPSSSDVRHQFVGSGTVALPFHVRAGLVFTARTAAPYTITTGEDGNRDGTINDRPPEVRRNRERGSGLLQLNARLARSFRLGRLRLEVVGEGFNLTNRANWTAYDGVQVNTTFGRPVAAAISRQIQLGVRLEF